MFMPARIGFWDLFDRIHFRAVIVHSVAAGLLNRIHQRVNRDDEQARLKATYPMRK